MVLKSAVDCLKQNGEKEIEPEEQNINKGCINKEMLACKLITFVKDASISCYWQFLGLFFVSSGLSVAQYGLINGIGAAFQLVLYPIWGLVFDSLKRRRMLLFTFLCVVPSTLQFWSPWLVKLVGRYETVVKYSDNTTVILNSTKYIDHSKNYTISERLLNNNDIFNAFAANNIIASIFMCGMDGYIDGIVVKRVFTSNSGQSYGEQKLYGPIGYAVGTFLTGVAVDHFVPEHLSRYTAAFWLFLIFSIFLLPNAYILTNQINWEYGQGDKRKRGFPKEVLKVFLNHENFVFLFTVFISGVAVTTHESYLYLYMFEKMKPSETMLSLTTVIATLSELVIYPLSARIIKMSGSPIRCVLFGLIMFGIRLLVLSYCTAPWQILLNQLLRGPALSLPWAAVVTHTWTIFPKNYTTTAMGIIGSVFFIFSGIVTNILGGYVFNRWGGETFFRAGAVISFVWFFIALSFFELRRFVLEKKEESKSVINLGTTNFVGVVEGENQ